MDLREYHWDYGDHKVIITQNPDLFAKAVYLRITCGRCRSNSQMALSIDEYSSFHDRHVQWMIENMQEDFRRNFVPECMEQKKRALVAGVMDS